MANHNQNVLVFVLDLLKVCFYVKLESSVLQDLLCKFAWLDRSKIRLDRSKLMQIFFCRIFQLNPSPFDVKGFMFYLKYKRENSSHVLGCSLCCVWLFCKIKRWLPSHILRVSKVQDYVKNLVIDSVVEIGRASCRERVCSTV